jgi:hypothetical protein
MSKSTLILYVEVSNAIILADNGFQSKFVFHEVTLDESKCQPEPVTVITIALGALKPKMMVWGETVIFIDTCDRIVGTDSSNKGVCPSVERGEMDSSEMWLPLVTILPPVS